MGESTVVFIPTGGVNPSLVRMGGVEQERRGPGQKLNDAFLNMDFIWTIFYGLKKSSGFAGAILQLLLIWS